MISGSLSPRHGIMISGSLSPRHGASSGCGWRNGLQLWRVAANILNESRTADKGWSSSLGVGRVLTTPHRKKLIMLRIIHTGLGIGLVLNYLNELLIFDEREILIKSFHLSHAKFQYMYINVALTGLNQKTDASFICVRIP
jgi:hypothetical protein